MTGRQKHRPSCGMTSNFRSICGIGPVVGIDLVVGPTLVVSLTYVLSVEINMFKPKSFRCFAVWYNYNVQILE